MHAALPRPTSAAGDLRSTSQILCSVADELEHARALGLRVEKAICAIAVSSSIDSAIVRELQHLDAILQQLAALRDFAAAVAREADPSVIMSIGEALSRISLSEVRARLSGGRDGDDETAWEML